MTISPIPTTDKPATAFSSPLMPHRKRAVTNSTRFSAVTSMAAPPGTRSTEVVAPRASSSTLMVWQRYSTEAGGQARGQARPGYGLWPSNGWPGFLGRGVLNVEKTVLGYV